MTSETAENSELAGLAGKYLTFVLGHECYGVPVLKVREIIRLCDITPVPQMPDYIKGVLNLRGKIIPVADLRLKFRLAKVENTKHTCIVVVQVVLADESVTPIGLIVDAVEEVLNLVVGEIEPPPDFGTVLNTDYVLGMAKLKGSVKTLLDIDRVVNAVHSETSVVAGAGGKM
jgi:purine-binding chemotaxis protein CheW